MNIRKSNMTDEQLVASFKHGNKDAMGQLYSRYFMLVFQKCMSFTKNTDDASDLAQDIMIKVMDKIESFRGEAKFSTWLYSVTFNYCADRTRKKKGKYFESEDILKNIADQSEIDFQLAKEKCHRETVALGVFNDISSDDKQLLIQKYQLDKSIQDLQDIYQLSASALKMRLMRARAKAMCAYSTQLAAA